MIGPEHNARAGDSNKNAVEIEARDARDANGGEQIAADHSANDAENHVEQQTLNSGNYQGHLARDKTRDQPQNNPGENRHWRIPLL